MSENKNKDIGFDVLENSDMDTIERIGTDNMDIDKNARARMLRYTMNKYEKEKRELIDMKENTNKKVNAIEENGETVSGVERYEGRKLSHMIYIGMCSAAAVALVAGSVFMIKNHSFKSPDKNDKLAEVTTAATEVTTVLNTTAEVETTVFDSVVTTAEAEATNSLQTTVSESVATAATNVAQTETETTVTEINYEEARDRALESFMNEGSYVEYNDEEGIKVEKINGEYWNIMYAFQDVNGDDVPELFIKSDNIATTNTLMYVFDGENYEQAKGEYHSWDGTTNGSYISAAVIRYCPEEKKIYTFSKEGYEFTQIFEFGDDNTFKALNEFSYAGLYQNGELIQERTLDAYADYTKIVDSYNWKDLEFTHYADKNNAAEAWEKEQGIKSAE